MKSPREEETELWALLHAARQFSQPTPPDETAAILSLLIPGAGHLYKGHILAAIAFFAATVAGYLMFIVPGVVVHIAGVVRAYRVPRAERHG